MKDKLGEGGSPRRTPARGAGAAAGVPRSADMPVERAQRLGISCAWCGFRLEAGGPRMRLFESEGVQVGGEWVAHFHTDCGRAIMRLCAKRSLEEVCPQIAAVRPAAEIADEFEPQPARKAKLDAAALKREARDLAARGYTAQMISARLRAPYAVVAAALASVSDPARKAVRP